MNRHKAGFRGPQARAEHRPTTPPPQAMGLSREGLSPLSLQVKVLQGGPRGPTGGGVPKGGGAGSAEARAPALWQAPLSISLKQNPNYLELSFN